MNAVSKRLRLSQSRPPRATPLLASHDALLLPPPAGGGALEEEEFLLVEEDTTDSSLIITMEESQQEVKAARRRAVRKRKKKLTEEGRGGASESEEEGAGPEVEIDRQLDQSLETKSKQHNLTTVNVRNIIHEVITNEHVVAMMKAAINETEAVPAFEPKMTRSKFKEVVEKGVVIPAWNISPIKKTSDVNKAPQFVDIPLAEEDSSDEEYHPDEEEEDETAEDTFQESDLESTASSPRGSRLNRGEEDSSSPWQVTHLADNTPGGPAEPLQASQEGGGRSMGPPSSQSCPRVVADSAFLEKLHAVEEELAVCLEPYQPLSESQDEVGLMAYRTRSKRPLRDVPLGRLEAELRAPDITPDMYDSSSAHEDRDWTDWLRGLMTSDMENEEECDDEDDPEYNFLAEIDEPDVEDYRDDKAVRITKKEVNELMEELFETLKEDLAGQEVDDEGHEEEEEPQPVQTHTPQEQHHTGPGDDEAEDEPITELRTVKQQLELLRKRRQLGLQTHTLSELAWLFSTRPVFLYPELLPCASLDPALYCPRRTAAFTAGEDCLLVLGLRNMEGSSDPTKLVSQFLLRKTLVQVRRRILQCCRPGVPDNIVKTFRYQRVLRPMLAVCRRVDPAEQRPPLEREEEAMPPWLLV
ncbi:hypothetical protein EPR50_G00010560 [Perca flavescens]|uniref:GON-4-like protein n=2 Tax=Perca flavescens TaxID=8167 RepID=A0A484DJH3_PERFV|nr:hypothetical protein EPR50_G00010560 [Perca flavescens]